jgi:predicted ATPase
MGTESAPVSVPMVRSIMVEGLFEEHDVEVCMAEGGITLLFGTNGSGKSTLLRIISKMLSQDMSPLLTEPIRTSTIVFSDGSRVRFDRAQSTWTEHTARGKTRSGKIESTNPLQDPATRHWILRSTPFNVVEGTLVDSDGEPVPQALADRVLSRALEMARLRQSAGTPHVALAAAAHTTIAKLIGKRSDGRDSATSESPRTFIRPCRLINSDRLRHAATQRRPRNFGDERFEPPNAVQWIATELTRVIKDARESSRSKTSDIDATFFTRALPKLAAPRPLDAEQRTSVINDLRQLHNRLSDCALATSQLELPSLTQSAPEVQTIFDLYLQDLLKKAQATTEVLTRLEVFSHALNDHLVGKVATINAEDGLRLTRISDSKGVPLDRLSSGEQHLIVLFYHLIFDAQPSGVCLIDEPEISLNVDWQHRFVGNVIKVSAVAPQQYIIATHSPTLIREHEALLRPIEVVPHAAQ